MGAAWPGVATTKTGQSKSTARAGLVQVGSSSPDGGEAASASQVLPPPQPSAEHIPASHGSSAPSSSSTPRPVRKLNDQPPVSKNLSAEQQRAIALASDELARARGSKFHTTYTTLKVVGHGAFAKVHICQHNKTQELFAAKIIARSADDESKQRDGIIREIAIMRMLAEHPNTIKLVEVFEDSDAYYLVMELCKGGELFDQIIAKGHFTEKEAAGFLRCLFDFIAYAHERNIMHRDLKPENILLSDKSANPTLKVIDFGTSEFCNPGERLAAKFGTPYYVAPEVLAQSYDKTADIWSAGVIMYILLCGYPPFGGKTDARILQRVQAGLYSFAGAEWGVITEAAKDLISQMLVMDSGKRASARQVLQHRWFQVASTAPAAALGTHMVNRLKAFAGMSRMKRLALVVLARTLTDRDVKRLRELFIAMDANEDGKIDAADLHKALEKVGAAIDEAEMAELFHASDIDGSGQIDYEQFIAAMLDSDRVAKRRDAVRRSFEALDVDGDGFITAEDLVRIMPRGASIDVAREVLSEVDYDNDGKVDFKDFESMMQSDSGTPAGGNSGRAGSGRPAGGSRSNPDSATAAAAAGVPRRTPVGASR